MGTKIIIPDDMLPVLHETIKDVFGDWRVSEVEYAFDLGLQGKLDVNIELYNKPFNTVFLSQLMKAYKNLIAPAIEKEKKQDGYLNTPSEKEKMEVIIRNVNREFELYKRTMRVNNFGNAIYLALRDKITVDESELRPIAEEIYKKELESRRVRAATEMSYTRAISEMIKRAEDFNYNADDEERINRIMDDIKLKRFFNDVIEMEEDINNFMPDS